MKYKNELEIDVGRCLRAIIKKWKFILLITVLFAGLGVAVTLNNGQDLYSSTASLYSMASGSVQESMTGISVMNGYAEICTSYKVCERAALLIGRKDVDATTVQSSINVLSDLDSSGLKSSSSSSIGALIKISATSTEPELAMDMAEAVAKAFIMEIENVVGEDVVKLLDEPNDYGVAYSATRSAWKKRILATAAGVFIAVMVVIFFEIFDSKARTIRECSIRNELPIIGVIPDYKK